MANFASAYLIRGDDATLIGNALKNLTEQLLKGESRDLAIEEVNEVNHRDESGDYSLDSLLTAAQTIPFLTDSRVVVGRHMGAFSKKQMIEPLLKFHPSIKLILVSILLLHHKSATVRLLNFESVVVHFVILVEKRDLMPFVINQ